MLGAGLAGKVESLLRSREFVVGYFGYLLE
jgi:hypothetical protein